MKTATAPVQTKDPVFDIEDEAAFREKFDRQSFLVGHHLAKNPLFSFERLFQLVKTKQDRGEIYWDMGDIGVNQRWKETPAKNLSASEAFERIENANAWLLLRAVHRDPEYLAILNEGMAEVERLSGVDFRRYVKLQDSIIFITSPRRISTYHIDRECSMLLQIRGDKTIHIFDRKDREVLTEDEIERFWTVDNNAPRYKEQYQNRATSYLLKPGQAVHIPVNDPHWLKNGDDVSISLNINFHYHDSVRADLYRANYALRRLGLSPTPPGRSQFRDRVKGLTVGKPISMMKNVRARFG